MNKNKLIALTSLCALFVVIAPFAIKGDTTNKFTFTRIDNLYDGTYRVINTKEDGTCIPNIISEETHKRILNSN